MGTRHNNHYQTSSHARSTSLEPQHIDQGTFDDEPQGSRGENLTLVYIAAFAVGLLLLSVGMYLTILGYIDSEKDYAILGSLGIFTGLCFNFISVYRLFKTLHNKFMENELSSHDTKEKLLFTSSPSLLTEVRNDKMCQVFQSKYSFNPSILKPVLFVKSKQKKTVYFSTDEHEDSEVILLNKTMVQDHFIGQDRTPLTSLDSDVRFNNAGTNFYKLIKPNQVKQIEELNIHEQRMSRSENKGLDNSLVKEVADSSPTTQPQRKQITRKHRKSKNRQRGGNKPSHVQTNNPETPSNQISLPTSQQSPEVRVRVSPEVRVSPDTSLVKIKRRPSAQLKVVIETHAPTHAEKDVNPSTTRSGAGLPSQRVQTVTACVHSAHTVTNCDSGKASIDSLSILDENENVFLKGCAEKISPSKDFSDDFRLSISDSLSFDFTQQTDKKLTLLDVSKYSDTASDDVSQHRLPPIDVGEHRLPSIDVGEHRLPSIDVGEHRLVFVDFSKLRLPSSDANKQLLTSYDLSKLVVSHSDVSKHISTSDVNKHAHILSNKNVSKRKVGPPSSDCKVYSDANKSGPFGFMALDDHIEVLSE